MIPRLNQPPAFGEFKKRHAFLNRSASDAEEILPVSSGESTIPFCNIRSDRKGGAVELVDKEVETARECLCDGTDLIGKIHRLLVNEEFFECEGHLKGRRSEE